MSNHGDPWRKFVQTFFLAEQPNGYFVLNDIFRFLKEETVEGEDDVSEPDAEPEVAATPASPTPAASEPVAEVPAPVAAPEPTPAPAAPAVEEAPTTVIPEPIAPTPAPEPAPQKVNGTHAATPEAEPAPEPPVESRASTPEPAPTPPVAPAPAAAAPSAPAPAPPAAATPPPPAQPAAPPAPKTWANLAANNAKKWGSAVATESRGTTEVLPSPAPTSAPQAASSSSSPHQSHANGPPRGMNGGNVHPALLAAQTVTTAQCFVKGVVDAVSEPLLTQTLTQRFGAFKGPPEIVRNKACAFIEFMTVDAARKAITASLPPHFGGEGGIKIDVNGEPFRINVETKKERGDRPPSRPRGGAPTGGAERGSYRGRGGPGRGRGGPPPTPAK